MSRAGRYHMPQVPQACVMCGTPYSLSRQAFRFSRREIDLPVCSSCWKRHVASRTILRIAILLASVVVVGGVAAGLVASAFAPPVLGALIAA